MINEKKLLPQQRLLLELLISSGDIAVEANFGENTLLIKTLNECVAANWASTIKINDDFTKVRITRDGRKICANRNY